MNKIEGENEQHYMVRVKGNLQRHLVFTDILFVHCMSANVRGDAAAFKAV